MPELWPSDPIPDQIRQVLMISIVDPYRQRIDPAFPDGIFTDLFRLSVRSNIYPIKRIERRYTGKENSDGLDAVPEIGSSFGLERRLQLLSKIQ